MAKELERDLGLYATITVSIGAMVGSGIFVLPGLAAGLAGPAVVLAYLLAGLVVVPAALAKSEMATAMPESGGTYLYIDRAMGPLAGTVAGLGAWFSLAFKSAFALVGLGAYLLVFAPVPGGLVKAVALGLAALLVVVNVLGVRQTGQFQAVIVSLVLVALVGFIAVGLTSVEQANYHPFFSHGSDGLLAATGFVFVSYAGVTKIASVAEEVEDPGRNIPIGILGSVLLMMFVYTFVVYAIVGATPLSSIADSYIPMAVAARELVGPWGAVAISVVAVLALTSMANAGVLSSSRYPLAMSRDALLPPAFAETSVRYRTPVRSIALTGAVLLVLIAFVPVVELAKLASAFQLLVFTLVNVALVAFRESDVEWYDPEFVSPLYPWVQLFGIAGGLVLLTQMGLVPIVGAIAIVAVGVGWYLAYGRERSDREGAALDAIRRTTDEYELAGTSALLDGDELDVLIAVSPDTPLEREATLLRVAGDVVARQGGSVEIVRFEEVPAQTPLSSAAARVTPADESFESKTREVAASLDVPVDIGEVVAHETTHAVATHVREQGVDLVLGEWDEEFRHGEFLGEDVDWYIEHVACDLVFVRNRGIGDLEEIVVTTAQGPYDPLEVLLADALAERAGATIRFLHAIDAGASDKQVDSVRAYHDRLADVCRVETTTELLRADDRDRTLRAAAEGADLVVVSTVAHHILYDVVFGALPDRLATELDCTVLLVHSRRTRRHTFIRYLLDRFVS